MNSINYILKTFYSVTSVVTAFGTIILFSALYTHQNVCFFEIDYNINIIELIISISFFILSTYYTVNLIMNRGK